MGKPPFSLRQGEGGFGGMRVEQALAPFRLT
jgi:hypothetical protein